MPKINYGTSPNAQLASGLTQQQIAQLLYQQQQLAGPNQGGSYDPLGEQLNQAHGPVHSAGQGVADVIGDLGSAYFERQREKRLQETAGKNNASLAKAYQTASNPDLTGAQVKAATSGNVPIAEQLFSGPAQPEQRAHMAIQGLGANGALAQQYGPSLMQAAQASAPPSFSGSLKPGERAFVRGNEVASVPDKPLAAETPLSPEVEQQRVRIAIASRPQSPAEPLVQVYDPSSPTGVSYKPKAEAAGSPGPGAERKQKMQTFWSADGSARTLDANDPEDQKVIKSEGLVASAPTDTERGAKGFLDRMTAAESGLRGVVDKGFNPANKSDAAKSSIPLLGNSLVSDQYQSYKQYQEDWVRAKLRKESGAVIGKDEMADEIRTYFPQVGDNKATQEQKERSRREAQRQLATGAGILGRKTLAGLDAPAIDAAPDDIEALINKYAK